MEGLQEESLEKGHGVWLFGNLHLIAAPDKNYSSLPWIDETRVEMFSHDVKCGV